MNEMLFNGHHTHLAGDIVDVEAVGTLGTLDVVATANAYSCEVIAADRPCSTPVGAPVVVGAELELNIVVSEGVLNIPVVRSHLNHVDIGRPVICPVTNEGDHVILCRLLIFQFRPRVAHVVLVECEGVELSRRRRYSLSASIDDGTALAGVTIGDAAICIIPNFSKCVFLSPDLLVPKSSGWLDYLRQRT